MHLRALNFLELGGAATVAPAEAEAEEVCLRAMSTMQMPLTHLPDTGNTCPRLHRDVLVFLSIASR